MQDSVLDMKSAKKWFKPSKTKAEAEKLIKEKVVWNNFAEYVKKFTLKN